MKTRAR